jgi:hypothetical protein
MNKEQIKQELHELVDGLNEQFFKKELISRGSIYDPINRVRYPFKDALDILQSYQKPKEKTLEQKLIDAGFEPSAFKNIYYKNNIYVFLTNNNVKISYRLKSQKCCDLISNVDDHNQIFADIAYLESRVK